MNIDKFKKNYVIMTDEKKRLIDSLQNDIRVLKAKLEHYIRILRETEKLIEEKEEVVSSLFGFPIKM